MLQNKPYPLLRPHKCDVCHMAFFEIYTLQSHVAKLHSLSDQPKFQCNLCDKSYKTKAHLQRHQKNSHVKIKPYKCDICDKSYKESKTLEHHMATIHKGERIKCNECESTFKWKTSLDQHINSVHEKVIPYHCDLCTKSFPSNSQLSTHKAKGHYDNSDKELKCLVCAEAFFGKHSLSRHMKQNHNEVIDMETNKSYSCVDGRLQCDKCDKSFNFLNTLKDHIHSVHDK